MGATDLISSISKKAFFVFGVPVMLITGCAEKKIRPINEDVPMNVVQKSAVNGGPSRSSHIVRFLEKSADYGLKNVKGVHLYAVDANDDGLTDLVTLEDFVSSPKFYFFNKDKKQFVLGDNPFNEKIRASFLNFADLDHDDVLDVIVGSLNQKSELTEQPVRIYKGSVQNGKLTYSLKNVLQTGIIPTASIVVADFNLDGELDLFLGNWFSQKDDNPKPIPDSLFYGKGFSFTNVSFNLKEEITKPAPTFGASVCDVDKNGFPDILTATSNGYFNKMWMNIDGESFQDYGVQSGYAADNEGDLAAKGGGNSFFSLCGDYNNDQLVDIVTGNLFKDSDPEMRDKSVILSGRTFSFPPKFIRTEFFQNEGKTNYVEGNRRGVWIDYNLDGRSDLLIANSGFPPDSRLMFFEQEADHAFDDQAPAYGLDILNPSGMVTIDLNQDGVMDFISGQSNVRTSNLEPRIYVFENQTPRKNKGTVRFYLEGRRSNSRGLSSTIVLHTDKARRFSMIDYASGSLPSQNEEGILFAFNAETPKELEVRWSFGSEDKLNRVIPLLKKYSLKSFNLKGKHTEFNICDDGRILPRKKHCYR